MTSWADLRAALQTAVRAAAADAGVVSAAVAWSDERRPTGKVLVLLDIVSAVSTHDRHTETPDPLPAHTTTWSLSSAFSIQLQVRAETHEHTASADAMFALERVRASLHRPGLVIGAGAKLEWPEVSTITPSPYVADSRVVQSHSFEVTVRAVLDFAPGNESQYQVQDVVVEGESATPDLDTPAETEQSVSLD